MATLTSTRAALLELDPVFGFLPASQRDELVGLRLPLRSQRLQVEAEDRNHLLNPSTQKHLRGLVENDLFVKYNRCEKILRTQLLRTQMDKWTAANLYQRKEMKSVRRLMPDVLQLNVPDEWFYRRGLQTLCAQLWYAQQRRLRCRFFQWRYHTDARRNMLLKFLARWRWKASAWKLNKMKAARFVRLSRRLALRVEAAHRQFYYQRWLDYDLRIQMRIKMRLLFRCWKGSVAAAKAARRRSVVRAFRLLRLQASQQGRRTQAVAARHAERLQLLTLHRWLEAYKKRVVLRRLLCVGDRAWLLRALDKWKTTLRPRPAMPRLSQSFSKSVELSAPTPMREEVRVSQRAVFQSGDKLVYRTVTSVHKRGCSCCNRFPVDRSQLAPVPASPLISSLRDKIAWRLGVVKELDRSFVEHEEVTKPLWMTASPLPSPRASHLDSSLPFVRSSHQPDISPRRPAPPPSVKKTSAKASTLYGGAMGGGGSVGKRPASAIKAQPRTPASSAARRPAVPTTA